MALVHPLYLMESQSLGVQTLAVVEAISLPGMVFPTTEGTRTPRKDLAHTNQTRPPVY